MRPERRGATNGVSARSVAGGMAILLALLFLPSKAFGLPQVAPQTPAAPVYDSSAFISELAQMEANLEKARNSPENLRAYRESLPESWGVNVRGNS